MEDRIVMSAVQKAICHLDGDFAESIKEHAKEYAGNLRRLRQAAALGKQRQVRMLQHRTFRSFSAKVTCLIRSVSTKDQITAADFLDLLDDMDLASASAEPVSAWALLKASGNGWRPVVEFAIVRRARQLLIQDCLLAKFGVSPSDYLSRGRGADRASDAIRLLIEGGQTEYFVVADIMNFFRSVQHEAIPVALGLPEEVVRNSLLIAPNVSITQKGNLPTETTIQTFDGAVRQGLPQGSRASNLVASLLLGPTLGIIAPADRIVVHGDDIAIAARDRDEAYALKDALAETLMSHPAGPFPLKTCGVFHVEEGFNFLKYRQRRDYLTGEVRRRPARWSYERYSQRVSRLASEAPPGQCVRRVARYRWLWVRSFSRWNCTQAGKDMLYVTTLQAMESAFASK